MTKPKTPAPLEKKNEELQKDVDEARKKIAELEAKTLKSPVSFAGDADGTGPRQFCCNEFIEAYMFSFISELYDYVDRTLPCAGHSQTIM